MYQVITERSNTLISKHKTLDEAEGAVRLYNHWQYSLVDAREQSRLSLDRAKVVKV